MHLIYIYGHKGPIFINACTFKVIKASSYNPNIHCVFGEIVECESNHVPRGPRHFKSSELGLGSETQVAVLQKTERGKSWTSFLKSNPFLQWLLKL